MEYTLGSLNIPLKENIEKLFNKIGITRFKEMYTVKGKITENVCKNRINMKYFNTRFEEYISIFQENEEGEIIGIVTFEIEIEYIKIHILCANVKGVGKLLLDKVKELSNILKIKIVLMPSPVEKVFKYYIDNKFRIEGLHLVHYPDTVYDDVLSIKKTFDSKGGKGKTRKSKGGKGKTLKKYITKLKFYTLVPKEKYVPKNKTRKNPKKRYL
jgi:hypothetical protein